MKKYLCHHQKATEEAGHTDEEEKQFPTLSLKEEVGIHVCYGCHKSLQTYKLKKE